ncbi:MAG: 1-deoxy-D-xylulose-5-phosphate synthase [Pontibacterium sp.]
MFEELPRQRPNTPLLDQIQTPADLKPLTEHQLCQLAYELRAYLLYSVAQSGGHFGAGLGVVELTIALHYLLTTPEDTLIWDVGHQTYPHKILTGRREALPNIRQKGGLTPFPKRSESEFDAFGAGHSSTSISAALGYAVAKQCQGQKSRTVAVIGDGAMTAGMAFEALNHAAHTHTDILVILNDNDMSISENIGGLATYLAQKGEASGPFALFEALDFDYHGPIDGHDFDQLLPALKAAINTPGPQFLHVCTQKGKGFLPAEADPIGYHAITKLEPKDASDQASSSTQKPPKYSNVFGRWLCELAEQDKRLVGITPAMREGSDLIEFSKRFPSRYFDVAIAEQHSVTFAAGLACGGMKPVVAIYSTFFQRAYDQWLHDVAIQKLDVLLAIDRAGLVGEDGATHAGCYDISLLRVLPNTLVMTPSDETEMIAMLATGYDYQGPAAVRYPRGRGKTPLAPNAFKTSSLSPLEIGKAKVCYQPKQPSSVAILNFGPLLDSALQVCQARGYSLVDMRFVKPLDTQIVQELAKKCTLLVTLEDHAVLGGAGASVAEYICSAQLEVKLLNLGIPDRWIEHASREEQLQECGLDANGIAASIDHFLVE